MSNPNLARVNDHFLPNIILPGQSIGAHEEYGFDRNRRVYLLKYCQSAYVNFSSYLCKLWMGMIIWLNTTVKGLQMVMSN